MRILGNADFSLVIVPDVFEVEAKDVETVCRGKVGHPVNVRICGELVGEVATKERLAPSSRGVRAAGSLVGVADTVQ